MQRVNRWAPHDAGVPRRALRSFREMLEATLQRYHNRLIDAAAVIELMLKDAGERLVEVVAAACRLEAFVVHGEAFDQVPLQLGSGPLPELRAARRAEAIPNRKHELEVP